MGTEKQDDYEEGLTFKIKVSKGSQCHGDKLAFAEHVIVKVKFCTAGVLGEGLTPRESRQWNRARPYSD